VADSASSEIEFYSSSGVPHMKQSKVFSAFLLIFLTALFLGFASTPRAEGTKEFIADSVITTKVKTEIVEELSLKGFKIKVKTNKGVVQLSGSVDTQDNIKTATEVAQRVKGVKSVTNNIKLKK